ncbi:MAG: hypothetical protein GTN95_00025, partial [Gammaproteobacteria bacterium]|nr:hypothetical protein [Gammaproteobacteria bacterium]
TFGSSTVITGDDLDCNNTLGEADDSTDCDDTNATNYPGNAEVVADGLDQNCDAVDDCYQDLDNDTFGTTTV